MTPSASCLYTGVVHHSRAEPAHAFRYRLWLVYLDLGELPQALDGRWLWSARRIALARYRRRDYLGDATVPLDVAVRELVEARTGERPSGPIRMLTQLAMFGFCFNPVTFYYCFATDGRTLTHVVAEITNTPWRERHAYVLAVSEAEAAGDGATLRWQFRKAFHVSPFLPMELDYDWRFTTPGERVAVRMEDRSAGRVVFDATLAMTRRPLDGRGMAAVLARHPATTVKVVAAIYWQALRLRLKRAQFFAHPRATVRGTGTP